MAASMPGSGRSTIVRTLSLCRASTNLVPARRPSLAVPPRTSNFTPVPTPIVHPPPLRNADDDFKVVHFDSLPRLLRRELSSFKPVHIAFASAYLVSKLSSEASISCEGRFANYLSPI